VWGGHGGLYLVVQVSSQHGWNMAGKVCVPMQVLQIASDMVVPPWLQCEGRHWVRGWAEYLHTGYSGSGDNGWRLACGNKDQVGEGQGKLTRHSRLA
jgi:hypothetical protein